MESPLPYILFKTVPLDCSHLFLARVGSGLRAPEGRVVSRSGRPRRGRYLLLLSGVWGSPVSSKPVQRVATVGTRLVSRGLFLLVPRSWVKPLQRCHCLLLFLVWVLLSRGLLPTCSGPRCRGSSPRTLSKTLVSLGPLHGWVLVSVPSPQFRPVETRSCSRTS